MIKHILKKLFNKKVIKKDNPMTIINDNRRANALVRQRVIYEKKERQKTCLSKYFEDIKGLNAIDRNIYCEIKF